MSIYAGLGITLTEPLVVSIDKEYFREKFQSVFDKWEPKLWIGMTPEDQKEMLEQIIGCLNG